MTTSTPAAPARRRSPALVALDLTAGIIIALFGMVFTFGVIVTALSIAQNLEVTDESLRSTITTIMIAVAVFGWAITSGMFIVRAIQRRYAFYWPIIGIIILTLSVYVGTFAASTIAVNA